MAKRSLGELTKYQRKALTHWANHMGVTEGHMVNWLNGLDGSQAKSPWANLDNVANQLEGCGCDDC
jgi:hypothetical protein